MRTYSVFAPPVMPGGLEENAEALKFVPHGWSLWALIIPALWMALRRLWWVLLFYVLIVAAIQVIGLVVPQIVTLGLSIAFALVLMVEAGTLRMETLLAKGYREIAVLQAKNQKAAELAFFTAWVADEESSETPAPPAAKRGTLHRPLSGTPPALPGLPGLSS